MADKAYSYDAFYRVGDGYGEHIQVVAEDLDALIKGREELQKALIALGAGPLPRDIAFSKPAPQTEPSGHNPNRLPQNGQGGNANSAPVCPDCGAGPMIARRPKEGQDWNAFWGCREWRNTGCKGKRYM